MPIQMYMALPSFPSSADAPKHLEILDIDEEELDTSHLTARIVEEGAKRRLLSDQHPWPRRTDDAETLLRDLGRLAPSVAKDFIPRTVARNNLKLRLINDIDFAGEESSFVALSYCWNKVNHDAPRKEISPVGDLPFGWVRTVEQFPLPTSPAMFEAVLRERGQNEGLWFDQVCINRDDETEKVIAIAAIDSVYSNARAVIVALDDIAAPEDELGFLTRYIDQYGTLDFQGSQHPNRGLSPPLMQQQPALWRFFDRILGSIWFERAWCMHELRMSRNHIFLVPCCSEEDDEAYTFIRFTSSFLLHMLLLAGELTQIPSNLHSKIQTLSEHFTRLALQNQHAALAKQCPQSRSPPRDTSTLGPPSFIPLVSHTFALKAGGNPLLPEHLRRLDANRDKACIALNASQLPLALKPTSPFQRPNIEDECLRQLLLVGLAARDPMSLCTTGPALRLHDGSISWLSKPLEFNMRPSLDIKEGRPRLKEEEVQSLIHSSDGRAEYVQLPLLFLELPHRSVPNSHLATHIHRARTFIDLAVQGQIQIYPFAQAPGQIILNLWGFVHSMSHPRAAALKNVFVQTLACCFELGTHWLLDVLQSSPRPQTPPNTQGLSAVLTPEAVDIMFNPLLIIQNYFLRPDCQMAISALLSLVQTIVEQGITWASGANERTHGPLIVSTPQTSPILTPSQLVSPHQYMSPSSASQGSFPSPHPTPSPQFASSGQPSPYTVPPAYLSGALGRAIVFAPYAYTKTLLIAIPRALVPTAYADLARAWILTPMNPYTNAVGAPGQRQAVCWRLQGKGCLFGDRAFAEGAARQSESGQDMSAGARSQRVYGPES